MAPPAMSDRELGLEVDAEVSERAELVRTLNAAIRNASEGLPEETDMLLEFYCECGCWETLELTVAQYEGLDGQPVLREGHPASADEAPPTGEARSRSGP